MGLLGLGLYVTGHRNETAGVTAPVSGGRFIVNDRKYPEVSGRVWSRNKKKYTGHGQETGPRPSLREKDQENMGWTSHVG